MQWAKYWADNQQASGLFCYYCYRTCKREYKGMDLEHIDIIMQNSSPFRRHTAKV